MNKSEVLEERPQKRYSLSFLKVFFAAALLLGILFLSLGVMRIYVSTLEKRLSRIDSALASLQNDYAQSVYAFAVATKPAIVLETSRNTQQMSISFHKTAMLHVPVGKSLPPEILLAKGATPSSSKEPSPLRLAEKALMEFFTPFASAGDEY